VPPNRTCMNEYVPLRFGIALLSIGIGVALLMLAWRSKWGASQQGVDGADAASAS